MKKPTQEYELIRRICRKDMPALAELASLYQARIYHMALRLLKDPETAEDITQETFLRVYKAACSYQPKAKLSTWLYRITYNLCLDSHRRNARGRVPLEHAPEPFSENTPEEILGRRELSRQVQAALEGLPERQKKALILHRYQDLSHEEIAEVTGWSRSAVESLLVRAYENLRKSLKELRNS